MFGDNNAGKLAKRQLRHVRLSAGAARAVSRTALVIALATSAGASIAKKPAKIAAVAPDAIYMERATFGDILGLQPGFENLVPPLAEPIAQPVPQSDVAPDAAISPQPQAEPMQELPKPDRAAPAQPFSVPTIAAAERDLTLPGWALAAQKDKAQAQAALEQIDLGNPLTAAKAEQRLADLDLIITPAVRNLELNPKIAAVGTTFAEGFDTVISRVDMPLPNVIAEPLVELGRNDEEGGKDAVNAPLDEQLAETETLVELAPPIIVAAAPISEPKDLVPARAAQLPAAQLAQPGPLSDDEIVPILAMIGLPGESQIIQPAEEKRVDLVASMSTTSTTYEPRAIGLGGIETLRDAIEHAAATNPDVKIAEAQQEDAYYAVKEAGSGFLPTLDVSAGGGPEISRQGGSEEIMRLRREFNASLRQTLFDFGLTQFEYRRTKENLEAAKLETLISVEQLANDVANAYLGILQQQKVVSLSEQNLEAHRRILDMVNAQKDAGAGTAADVNRVSASLSNAESFMLEEESKLQQARDQYRRLLNVPPGLLVDPALNLSLLPRDADEAAERIENESPKLLQVRADTLSLRNQLRSQRGNYFPKLEMEVQGNMRTDVAGETGEVRDARAMMYLRYNLFNGGADVAVSNRLKARVKEIGYEFEKERREVEQDIRNDFTAIDASRAKVETIADQVRAAEEVVRLYEEQFRAGDRTAFDLLDAQQALITAKLERVANSYAETRSALRVLQQLGSLYYALTSGA